MFKSILQSIAKSLCFVSMRKYELVESVNGFYRERIRYLWDYTDKQRAEIRKLRDEQEELTREVIRMKAELEDALVEKKQLMQEVSPLETETLKQQILGKVARHFPVKWDEETQLGHIVLQSCPGEGCTSKPYTLPDRGFVNLVDSALTYISKGIVHQSKLCSACRPFDVYQTDEGKWRVVTQICQLGGCESSYAEFDSQEAADDYAKRMYDSGKRTDYDGLCDTCSIEYQEMCI